MNKPSQYLRTIRIAYVLSFLNECWLPIAVWFFFYLRFLTIQEIAAITAIRVIVTTCFEIPTGAFADIVGRKTSVFLSFSLFALVMIGMTLTQSFWIFCLLEIFRELANSLYSGSLEALAYDTLKEHREESAFDHVISRMETVVWIGLFIASITGGFLYFIHPNLPYIIQAGIYVVAAGLTLLLVEPRIDTKKYHLNQFLKQNIAGFLEITKSKKVAWISIILITVGSGYFIAAQILGISQARQYGMDSRGVGILFALGYILSALASYGFPKLKSLFGPKILFIIATGCLLLSFLAAKYVGIALGSLLIILRISSSTTFRNIRSILLNRYIESKNRATAISTVVLLSQLPYAFLAWTIGGYIDRASPNNFAWYLGMTLSIFLLLELILLPRFLNLKK